MPRPRRMVRPFIRQCDHVTDDEHAAQQRVRPVGPAATPSVELTSSSTRKVVVRVASQKSSRALLSGARPSRIKIVMASSRKFRRPPCMPRLICSVCRCRCAAACGLVMIMTTLAVYAILAANPALPARVVTTAAGEALRRPPFPTMPPPVAPVAPHPSLATSPAPCMPPHTTSAPQPPQRSPGTDLDSLAPQPQERAPKEPPHPPPLDPQLPAPQSPPLRILPPPAVSQLFAPSAPWPHLAPPPIPPAETQQPAMLAPTPFRPPSDSMPLLRPYAPPPPPSPAPPLAELPMITPLGAQMSSLFSNRYPASACIDRSSATLCATQLQARAWLSLKLPSDAHIGYVAVSNRVDHLDFMQWLLPFDVYVGGDAYGDVSASAAQPAQLCARHARPAITDASTLAGPFVAFCGGVQPTSQSTPATYVTIRLAGAVARYLSVAEVAVYRAPPPPPRPPEPPRPPSSPPLPPFPPNFPSPPQPPPPPPPAPPRIVVNSVNRRFRNGGAFDTLDQAGVLVHMADSQEDMNDAWHICRSGWCAGRFDHASCSLINAHIPNLFNDRWGLIFSSQTKVECFYTGQCLCILAPHQKTKRLLARRPARFPNPCAPLSGAQASAVSASVCPCAR